MSEVDAGALLQGLIAKAEEELKAERKPKDAEAAIGHLQRRVRLDTLREVALELNNAQARAAWDEDRKEWAAKWEAKRKAEGAA